MIDVLNKQSNKDNYYGTLKRLLFLLSFFFTVVLTNAQSLVYYVATDGDDNNLGTENAPFLTLEKARNTIRLYKEENGMPNGDIVVLIKGGYYQLQNEFSLSEEDGGSSSSMVIYKSYDDSPVVLTQGIIVSPQAINIPAPSILDRVDPSVRDRLREINFAQLGISNEDYGNIRYWQNSGLDFGNVESSTYVGGQRLEFARYPKDTGDENGFLEIGSVLHVGNRARWGIVADPTYPTFGYLDNEVENWANYENIWMYGYWDAPWGDGTLQIRSIDAENNTISTIQSSYYGMKEGQPYYYFNVLEELKLDNEMFFDFDNGKIYYLEPENANAEISISLGSGNIVHNDGADYVTFDGIDFTGTTGDAVLIENASYNTIKNFRIFEVGGKGIEMPIGGEYYNKIYSGEMSQIGESPFVLGGGDLGTQEFGYSFIADVKIDQFGLQGTSRSILTGVGNAILHCEFSDSKSGAIGFSGNENLIAYNIFANVNQTSTDAGAVYAGRDPSSTGHKIKYNYFEDIGSPFGGTGVQGIYIDDRSSFVEVYGNIFKDVGSGGGAAALKVNGGKHVVFENNIVYGERTAYIQWHRDNTWLEFYDNQRWKLEKVNYEDPCSPWSIRYPLAKSIIDVVPQQPYASNILRRNIAIDSELSWGVIINEEDQARNGAPQATEEGNWEIDYDPGFASIENGDFSIPQSEITSQFPDFEWLDFNKMGLIEEEFNLKEIENFIASEIDPIKDSGLRTLIYSIDDTDQGSVKSQILGFIHDELVFDLDSENSEATINTPMGERSLPFEIESLTPEYAGTYVFNSSGSSCGIEFKLTVEENPCGDGLSKIEAECFDDMQDVQTQDASEGGLNVSHTDNGDWTFYSGIDLTGMNTVNFRVSTKRDGSSIELRLGSLDGDIIADIPIQNTGDWQAWTTQTGLITETSGIHDIYVIYKGDIPGLLNLNWFGFSNQVISSVEVNSLSTQIKLYPNPVEDHITIEGANGSNYELFDNSSIVHQIGNITSQNEVINVERFSRGIYFIKLIQGESAIVEKIIIK